MHSQHIRALTGVRFFAALWVVLYHSTRHNADVIRANHPDAFGLVWPVIGSGAHGVDLFFMLSGFVLALNYSDQLGAAFDVRRAGRFLWLRLARIWPLYILVILGAGALRVVRHELWDSAPVGPLTLVNFLRQALMVQMWFPPERGPRSWVGPAWSLSSEWLAYLLFPIVVLVVARLHHRLRTWQLLVLAALALAPFLVASTLRGDMGGHVWVLRILCEFVAGMLLCAAASRLELTPRLRGWAGVGAMLSVAAIIAWLATVRATDGPGWALIWVVAFFAPLIFFLAIGTGPLHDLLANRWLVLGGGLSYALYLVHSPMLNLFRDVTEHTRLHLEPRAQYYAELLFLPVMVLVAWFLYRFFEEPVRRRMTRLVKPIRPVPAYAEVVVPPESDRRQDDHDESGRPV